MKVSQYGIVFRIRCEVIPSIPEFSASLLHFCPIPNTKSDHSTRISEWSGCDRKPSSHNNYHLQAFIDVIGKQRQYLTETLKLGEDILAKSHQEAVPIMKKWLIVLKQRMGDVDTWSADFEKRIQVR